MHCLWMAVLFVGTLSWQGISATETHSKRDLPMFRMGRSLERAAGPRMGRDSEEADSDEYKNLLNKMELLYPVDFDPDTDSEDKEQADRAIPYPRVGRALNMFRMGKRGLRMMRMGRSSDDSKRALRMLRMGRAMSMIRMGRGYENQDGQNQEQQDEEKRALHMVRMGRSYETDKRALNMFRMGKRDDDKRALAMVRMGRSEHKEE